MLISVFIGILCATATAKHIARPLSRSQPQCPDCTFIANGNSMDPNPSDKHSSKEDDNSHEEQELIRTRRTPSSRSWLPPSLYRLPNDVSSEPIMNLGRDDMESSKRNDGTNLSIVNPMEVLRQRMRIDKTLQQLRKQIDENQSILDNIGKRQLKSWQREWR